MLLKHFKQLSFTYSKTLSIIRNYSANSTTTKHLLSDYFGLSSSQVDLIARQYKLDRIKHENLVEVLKFLNENNFSKDEILDHPPVLKMHPSTLEQHYLFLQETGFSKISPELIAKCRKLYSKTIRILKFEGFLPEDLNVAENYKRYLKPLPDDFDVSDLKDDRILIELHLVLVKRFLVWRLNSTTEEIDRVFRVYKMIKNKSLRNLCENIRIAEELGFTEKRMLKYAYILQNYPKYPQVTLNEFANIAGADLRRAMKAFPKLIMVSPKNYVKIYGILKEHNIPDDTIRKNMTIFFLSPETIKLRLQELETIPELRALLCNPRVLRLIVHHNRARSRLSFLQQLELKCASLVVLGSHPGVFDSHIKQGKDINPHNEVRMFLKSLLQEETIDFEKFRKHPFYQNVPYVQMEETYDYLTTLEYNKASILNALHILLYPKEHIKNAVNKVKKQIADNVKKLTQVQQLNLILYFIEREHHFTGNGVWKNSK